VVSIVPCIAFGPPVQLPATPTELNVSLNLLWKVFSGEMKDIPAAVGTGSFVDVRDVARVHVWTIENHVQSTNQRYLVAASKGPVQAFADILREGYLGRTGIIPKGRPREGYRADYMWGPEEASLSPRKLEATGAIDSWIGLEQSILDAAKELERFL
jgi:nucleoside-diphosphate-sugar epimerase